LHFFEDRVETLEAVTQDQRLQDVSLYLCDWGYSTPDQRLRGARNPRIEVIDRAAFAGVLAQTRSPHPSR
ncbi:unnamed protein product, partial [Phaeothamnion confervicola]